METVKDLGKVTAIDLASYISIRCGALSHLKLQKLLYYCEAYHLAYFKRSVIDENFEAWVHGPVCRELYNTLKDLSIIHSEVTYDGDKEKVFNTITKSFTDEQVNLINDVLDSLCSWSGFELESATHKELPWLEARQGLGPAEKSNRNINKHTMQDFYSKELGF